MIERSGRQVTCLARIMYECSTFVLLGAPQEPASARREPSPHVCAGQRRVWDSNPRGRVNALAVFKGAERCMSASLRIHGRLVSAGQRRDGVFSYPCGSLRVPARLFSKCSTSRSQCAVRSPNVADPEGSFLLLLGTWVRYGLTWDRARWLGERTVALLLHVVEFTGPRRWRWLLADGSGRPLADHPVDLDESAAEYGAFTGLYKYLRWNAVPDQRTVSEAQMVARVGAWAGREVLGSKHSRRALCVTASWRLRLYPGFLLRAGLLLAKLADQSA